MKSSIIRIALLGLSILAISLLHYLTPLHLHYLHDIFQRLYYLPIILAAFWFGFRGGLACSIFVSVVYVPHVLFQWGGLLTVDMEKYLEIVLYNIVGGVTGWLAQRERERSRELERTAAGLEESYRTLQRQSERIIAVEEHLRRAEKLSTLGEMAAVLAHEIRNPLGSIRGTAEILRDDYKPGNPKFEFIEIQIKETERLNRVVEDFLRMARPQPGEIRRCALREELETIAALVATDARERGIRLDLQPVPADAAVRGDGEKLRQAFLNIVINALQATPPGGSVEISAQPAGPAWEIGFRDSGAGITPEARERIFEPFFTTKPDGTGLGLAITKKIVEGHGGTLEVASEAGRGTTVVVSLPVWEETP
ncbi:nitrogen regulation protein NR(II) [Geobacter sp. SVR]|uniref:two-component system sensor histidine kinase NtrB n=1 Tax=Geobacter sp. SVR TaxID=2495594 RepID=UPI00143EFB83|nr:ATP-binding protein [Geobacter sp. SVR]BCS52498.1 sensor histidine kinase [Geobacter sp. SVR]GCF84065.1 sensor histidine kinase [Geobacter sp. SVR]